MVTIPPPALRFAALLRLAIAGVVVIGLIWTWVSRPQGSSDVAANAARVGAAAPEIKLQGMDSKPVSLIDLKGKVVVLNFWATWCPPCRAEMAALNQVQKDFAGRGLIVLGVNQMEDARVIKRFMEEQSLDFPIALDSFGVASEAYRVRALPTTFFVDRDGIIRDVVYGGPMAQAFIESKVLPMLEK